MTSLRFVKALGGIEDYSYSFVPNNHKSSKTSYCSAGISAVKSGEYKIVMPFKIYFIFPNNWKIFFGENLVTSFIELLS